MASAASLVIHGVIVHIATQVDEPPPRPQEIAIRLDFPPPLPPPAPAPPPEELAEEPPIKPPEEPPAPPPEELAEEPPPIEPPTVEAPPPDAIVLPQPKLRPKLRPKPQIKPRAEPRAKPRVKQKTPPKPPVPSTPPKTEKPTAAPSPVPPKPVSTAPSQQSVDSYFSKLYLHIDKVKRYPSRALRRRLQGRIVIEVKIGRDGDLIDVKVIQGQSKLLTDAAVDAVRQSAPFPSFPPDWQPATMTFRVPLEYRLR